MSIERDFPIFVFCTFIQKRHHIIRMCELKKKYNNPKAPVGIEPFWPKKNKARVIQQFAIEK